MTRARISWRVNGLSVRCSRMRLSGPRRSRPRRSSMRRSSTRTFRCNPIHHLARPGLTVVEVLVALVLVAVGLLAIAGASALALRAASLVSRERLAVRQADRRLARLTAAGCTSASAGTDSVGGMLERWTIADSLGGVASVEASVEWQAGARLRVLTLRSALVC